ncbi:MAG: NTP transferase domain-containing protein [Nitrospinae bacterium]|nr:NTP transferase domain-containing protein [Nitrospinota bacterium]
MQAIILAGGKGTRLRPYTTVLPKPLMPVGDYPILEIILRQLKQAGFNEIILAVGHMSHLFEAFFQDGSRFGVNIHYSFEEKELGTAGPIAMAADKLKEDFLVMNGDVLTTLDYARLMGNHKARKAAATISTFNREVKIDFGVLEGGKDNRLERYIEKPTYHFTVSMGVNVLSRDKVLPHLPVNQRMDIPELMMKLHEAGEPVMLHHEPCFWLDIGRVDDYQAATEIFESRKAEFFPNGK